MSDANIETLRPKELVQALELCFSARRPIMVWGPPGVGKSQIMAQLAAKQDRRVIDIRLLLCDPTDIKGIPYYDPEDKRLRWAQMGELPDPDGPFANAILFLDEISAAPPQVQSAALQLVLDRKVGEYELPPGVDIACAGNRESDRGTVYKMPSPLANRLIHVELAPEFEDWKDWAIKSGNIRRDVLAYLSTNKSKLFEFRPKDNERAFPTPRTWEFVNQILEENDDIKSGPVRAAIAGAVGAGVAGEFMRFKKFEDQIPKTEDIFSGKVTKLDSDNPSVKYTVIINLCFDLSNAQKKLGETNKKFIGMTDTFIKFLMNNLEAEHVVFGMNTLTQNFDVDVDMELDSFQDFFKRYRKLIRSGNGD